MDDLVRYIAMFIGMAAASIGIMAIVSTRSTVLRMDGAFSILVGVGTLVAANSSHLIH